MRSCLSQINDSCAACVNVTGIPHTRNCNTVKMVTSHKLFILVIFCPSIAFPQFFTHNTNCLTMADDRTPLLQVLPPAPSWRNKNYRALHVIHTGNEHPVLAKAPEKYKDVTCMDCCGSGIDSVEKDD